MKDLLFESIVLVSRREKAARRVTFHPKTTVITGKNDVGKSSIIKSIFHALGAEPHGFGPRWKNADAEVLLRFRIEDKEYAIYRHRKQFALQNLEHPAEIQRFTSVTSELGPALASLFDFKLRLPDKNSQPILAPPAFLLLPFYIDQDKGWTETWASFKGLGQFSRWKKPVIDYHLGIKPNSWYELDGRRRSLLAVKEAPASERDALVKIKRRYDAEFSEIPFDIDIAAFRSEIERLLDESKKLKESEDRYRRTMSELGLEKIRLEAQIEILSRTRSELESDYNYAVAIDSDVIDCPTCGAEHNGGFLQRFEFARDAEECADLLSSLKEQALDVERRILSAAKMLDEAKSDQNELQTTLSEKQGELTLADIVRAEGRKDAAKRIESTIDDLTAQISDIDNETARILSKMDELVPPGHRKSVLLKYQGLLSSFSKKLNITFDDKVFKRFDATVEESGSDQPRSILAYQAAIVNLIRQGGNAAFCPIVIDAPNQQEQDFENLPAMLEFIRDEMASSGQLILSLGDRAGVDFEGSVIELRDEWKLLSKDEYEAALAEVSPFE